MSSRTDATAGAESRAVPLRGRPSRGRPSRALQWRVFFTCWVLFSLHFATDFVREHFLVTSMVDDRSFDLGKYYGMHPDIFRNPPEAPHGGVHHGANPGISMIAAVPYLLLKPVVDRVVERDLARRKASGADTAAYRDPRQMRIAFYQRARALGVDLRFGLIGLITQVLCMAPLSAFSVVIVLRLLLGMGIRERSATWLSLAYAFCTPVLFRTAYLNQNLAIGIFALLGFAVLWDPLRRATSRWGWNARLFGAGLMGGTCFLNDYSGALATGLLGVYALWLAWDDRGARAVIPAGAVYTLGALGPILVLWYYQWAAFGNFILPPQNWMAPVTWIEVGYKGVGGPQPDLLWMLLAEPRYGLFTSAPLLLLALAWPYYHARRATLLPLREALVCLAMSLAFVVFFSAVQYTRLQWVTGIRYLMPVIPFLFLLTADVLRLVPRAVSAVALLAGFAVDWALAMTRSQAGVVQAIESVLRDGVSLPVVTTLSKMTTQYLPWGDGRLTATPLFVLAALLVAAIWLVPLPRRARGAEAAQPA
ncbi:MAG: hypothetical protein IT359_02915 [Gemmatimonadaceae bacterium]|nr:hypothetical protein [Gemmatimonadaceae bacterium]